MATFVLIHGSGENARCWERVGGLLAARGHGVVAPDLPKVAPEWTKAKETAQLLEQLALKPA